MPRQKSTHVDDPAAVGLRLRQARERSGLTQRELAFSGCSPAYISRIESGDRIPSLQLLRELGRRLDVSEDFLATGDDRLSTEDGRLLEAQVALRLDERDHAERLFNEVLEAPWGKDDRATALAGLGELSFGRGDAAKAVELIEEALGVWGARPADQPALADTLGRSYSQLGRLGEAAETFRASLAAADERGDAVEQIRFAVLLANTLIDRGELDQAAHVLADRAGGSEDVRDPLLRARLYWSQSRLHAANGDSRRAARYARRALELVELTNHDYYIARAHELLAHVELGRDKPEQALRLLERGWPLLESGSGAEKAAFRLQEARALALLGRSDEADALATEAAGLLDGAEEKDTGRSYALLAEIYATIGDRARALELVERAVGILEEHPGPHLVRAYSQLAELLEADGRADEALTVLKRAVDARTAAYPSG